VKSSGPTLRAAPGPGERTSAAPRRREQALYRQACPQSLTQMYRYQKISSAWIKPTLPTPPVAPSVFSCLRLALWCSSAFAGSKSGWRQPVRQLMSGVRLPVALPPQAPAARPPDRRRRIPLLTRRHPKAHRDRFFAASAAQKVLALPAPTGATRKHARNTRNMAMELSAQSRIGTVRSRGQRECPNGRIVDRVFASEPSVCVACSIAE
jgi:hypothetical protein